MSSVAQSWVWKHSQSRGSVRNVLLRISDQAGHQGENAWPGIDTIAADCRIGRRQAQKCIRQLEELGELLVFPNAGGSRDCPADNRPNRYDLPMVPGWQPPAGIKPRLDTLGHMTRSFTLEPEEPDGVNAETPRGVSHSSPRDLTGCPAVRERGELQGTDGVSHSSPDMPLSSPKSRSARAKDRPDYSDWRPPTSAISRIKIFKPEIPEVFMLDTLPEFLVFAETRKPVPYRPDQLEAKFVSNVLTQWQRSKRGTGGLPEGEKELTAWAQANKAPSANVGETLGQWRKRLQDWVNRGRPPPAQQKQANEVQVAPDWRDELMDGAGTG